MHPFGGSQLVAPTVSEVCQSRTAHGAPPGGEASARVRVLLASGVPCYFGARLLVVVILRTGSAASAVVGALFHQLQRVGCGETRDADGAQEGNSDFGLVALFRLTRVLCRFPYTLALLPHDKVPDAEKKEILEQAFAPLPDNREAMEDPLDEYFTRKLVDRFNDEGIDKDELLDPNSIWSVAIRMWSWTIMLTVALIEFAHGRGRARCKKGELCVNHFCKQC